VTSASLRALTILFATVFPACFAMGQVMAPALTAPLPPAPHRHPASMNRASVPSGSGAGASASLTKEDLKQLNEIMQHMGQKDRKQFIKAVQQMTPEGRKQLIEGMRRSPAASEAHGARQAAPRRTGR